MTNQWLSPNFHEWTHHHMAWKLWFRRTSMIEWTILGLWGDFCWWMMTGWRFGTCFPMYWESWSQLTSIFQRDWNHQPGDYHPIVWYQCRQACATNSPSIAGAGWKYPSNESEDDLPMVQIARGESHMKYPLVISKITIEHWDSGMSLSKWSFSIVMWTCTGG